MSIKKIKSRSSTLRLVSHKDLGGVALPHLQTMGDGCLFHLQKSLQC